MAWLNLPLIRERIAKAVREICEEEGLTSAAVSVDVQTVPVPVARIEIEEYREVDATDPKWERMRGGKRWQDN